MLIGCVELGLGEHLVNSNGFSVKGPAEGSASKPESSEANTVHPAKRGRGRPKKNADTSPAAQNSPPVNTPVSGGGSILQQPKRRGRKPKSARESFEPMETDSVNEELETDELSKASPNSKFHNRNVPGGTSTTCTPMETDDANQGTLESNFFSSILKSEQPFGIIGRSSSGIPGLDLDECDASITAVSSHSQPVLASTAPTFNFLGAHASGIDEECKSLQQLSITKADEGLKNLNLPTPEVKKEDASNEGLCFSNFTPCINNRALSTFYIFICR